MRTAEPAAELRPAYLWLLLAVAVTVAPHASHLPAWLSALCAMLLVWQAWSLRTAMHKPGRGQRVLVLLVAAAAAVGIRVHFGHFFGKDPGVALLAVLLCLKLLEGASARDVRAAVLLSFFLQLGLFFYNQTLPVAALALTGTLLATVTLVSLQSGSISAGQGLRTGGSLMLQATPFLLVLFVLFPRIPGPLWGLPADAHSGVTGLSDSMAPGSISQLSLSDAIAFRAEFDGPLPPPAQRYWRGPVLSEFDGRTWRPGRFTVAGEPAYTVGGQAYDYRLTIEPHNQPWLLALDFPAPGLAGARYASNHQLLAENPVRNRARYDLRSHPDTPVGLDENNEVLRAAIRLPEGSNPRTRALARQLAEDAADSRAVLDRVLARLRQAKLTYTLRPPLLGTHSIDEFLFDARRGFCEHFAAAFVFLMRAADVPARVVTGYQGGTVNPFDGSLVVRQSDAHAWAEVWLPGRGWLRVDPTALAAPSRIEAGLAASLPSDDPRPFMMRHGAQWLHDIRHQWEALSNVWNQAVLGYDTTRQRRFLERLGFSEPDWRLLAALLASACGALMLALIAWASMQRRNPAALDRAWERFCEKLSQHDLARLPWEGPIDYAERIARERPAWGPAVREIATLYARLGYGRADEDMSGHLRRLLKRIDEFKPK